MREEYPVQELVIWPRANTLPIVSVGSGAGVPRTSLQSLQRLPHGFRQEKSQLESHWFDLVCTETKSGSRFRFHLGVSFRSAVNGAVTVRSPGAVLVTFWLRRRGALGLISRRLDGKRGEASSVFTKGSLKEGMRLRE